MSQGILYPWVVFIGSPDGLRLWKVTTGLFHSWNPLFSVSDYRGVYGSPRGLNGLYRSPSPNEGPSRRCLHDDGSRGCGVGAPGYRDLAAAST